MAQVATRPLPAGADALERLGGLENMVREIGDAVQKSHQPSVKYWDRPKSAIERVAKAYQHIPTYTGPFQTAGEFWKCVRSCPNQHWQDNSMMKSYINGFDTWYKGLSDFQQKSYRQYMGKAAPSGLNETLGTDGGFLIPPQFVQQLLMRAYDNDLLARTTMFPMTSNQLVIPAIDETSRADGSRFGGVTGYWEGEAQTASETKPQFARLTLNLSRLTLLVRATDEIIEDAGPALETYIDTVASQELAFKIGDAIINGTGAQMPLGVLNSKALITVAKDAGQAAASLTTNNIVNMWARMFLANRANSVWLINQDVEPALYTLTLPTGTAGVVTFMPPGGLSGQPYATLMGRPVIPIEFAATLGTVGDIMLVDLASIVSGTKGGMQSAVSMHVYFESAEQVFRFIFRADARCWWLNSLTPKNGTNTKSPLIALASRS